MIQIKPGNIWEPVRWDRWKEIAPKTYLVESVWGAVVQESLLPACSQRRPLLHITLSPFWERVTVKKEGGYLFEGRIEWVPGPKFDAHLLARRLIALAGGRNPYTHIQPNKDAWLVLNQQRSS